MHTVFRNKTPDHTCLASGLLTCVLFKDKQDRLLCPRTSYKIFFCCFFIEFNSRQFHPIIKTSFCVWQTQICHGSVHLRKQTNPRPRFSSEALCCLGTYERFDRWINILDIGKIASEIVILYRISHGSCTTFLITNEQSI